MSSRPLLRYALFGGLLLATLHLLPACRGAAPEPQIKELWYYYNTNLQTDANVEPTIALLQRAAKAGYTHLFFNDTKLGHLNTVPPSYFTNVRRVIAAADAAQIKIIPGVFPMGWANSVLSQNPNLIEALPVRNALFVVQPDGTARLQPEPPVAFADPGFANPQLWAFDKKTVALEQGTAHVHDAKGINARIWQKLKLQPFHQYHLTIEIKTDHYATQPMVLVYSPDTKISLQHGDLGVKPTQDWVKYDLCFNTLDQSDVLIYFRAGWEGVDGQLWWRRPTIEEVGLVNLIRRPSAPLTVRREGADGAPGATLAEGKDYDAVSDPKMGQSPWPGEYDLWHTPPVMKTHLPAGTRLRVSYNHAAITGSGKTMICPSDPQTMALLRDQAQRVHALFKAEGYFMGFDEIRVFNWDDACVARHLDASVLLAESARDCTKLLQEVNPGGKIYVWSDMFDRFHNAQKDHTREYLTNGSFFGSWEGLDPSVIIVNWNGGAPVDSLRFFADPKQGAHAQVIAGYYDAPPEGITGWLTAARGVPKVNAVMYTTWYNNYADLERFAALVQPYRVADK